MEVPKRLVLDTTIIVRHLRGQREETGLIHRLQDISTVATTIVNAFELYYGAFKSKETAKNLTSARGFLNAVEVLDLDDDSAEFAGKVMANLESRGIALDPRDVLIGSIASKNGFSVVTRNRKHFERIPELQVVEPEEIEF